MQKRIPVKLPIITNIINGATRGLAVTAISGYQKFISPHKGFSCAHRVLYGCDSCSQYFKRVIAEEGIIQAIANAKGRFQECREANEILKSRRTKCRTRKKYYASRLPTNTLAIESGEQETPAISEDSEETNESSKQKLGGSQWKRKQRQANNNDSGGGNNNCDRCDYVDCTDCGHGLDLIPSDCGDDQNCNNPFEAMDCPDLSCPDLSCPDLNCGNADCLSGMDCSGLDCGALDCGGDCGSCG
ncbi:membrane protein insertion efficiency factor YidD [Phormidium tenue]|jgi:putative component of membrane protein insertase Oxa1/YidC/SpoIIIJ protein YidD|uniref:Membrane protein insertion efficiency factor YidD n=1 Tax=Phormidium tenue FACHB-1050 TaxID=2692857 RepID=A0ABR8C7Z8_9CYAN|nr:membrane protein insertion efficiency factor YidD [Phormidium tenue]MBD2316868.1 membrane protein insertion efficiency factor YidD [Phormidium tenue FACHB-1050]